MVCLSICLLGIVCAAAILAISKTPSDIHFLTEGQSYLRYPGQTVELECEFYAKNLDLFQLPIVWRKTQRQDPEGGESKQRKVPGGGGEEEEGALQVNKMGDLQEPFDSTGRYKVDLSQQPPSYLLRLIVKDLTAADTGDYSCDVISGRAFGTSHVTHSLHVRAHVEHLFLTTNVQELANLSRFFSHFNVDGASGSTARSSRRDLVAATEGGGRQNSVGCVAIGGYPPPAVDIYQDQKVGTRGFGLTRAFQLEGGTRGLQVPRYVTARVNRDFRVKEVDHGKTVKCEAIVVGLTPYTTSAKINAVYAPVVTCRGSAAAPGERNFFISCHVRCNPNITRLTWMAEDSGGGGGGGDVIISSLDKDNEEHWTLIKVQSDDFRLEARLYFRQVKQEHFRVYRMAAENSLGKTTAVVRLHQKGRSHQVVMNHLLPSGARSVSSAQNRRRPVGEAEEEEKERETHNQPLEAALQRVSATAANVHTLTTLTFSLLYLHSAILLILTNSHKIT